MDSWKKTVPSYIRTFLDLYFEEIEKEKMSDIADNCDTVIKNCDFIMCLNMSRRDYKFLEYFIGKNISNFALSINFRRLYVDGLRDTFIIGFCSEQDKDKFIQYILNFKGYFCENWEIHRMEFLDICEHYAQYFEINDGKITILE